MRVEGVLCVSMKIWAVCVGVWVWVGLVTAEQWDLWNILDPYINDARIKIF